MGRALRPIPQELFFIVGWAEEPVLFIFARGLILSAIILKFSLSRSRKLAVKSIKTIGDAVMASFISNEQAIMAAVGAVTRFREYNLTRPQSEWIQVRIGIHRGTGLLVNLHNLIDYFGSTVNKAARIQNLSKSDEVSFSEDVYNDQGFLTALKAAGVSEIHK